MSDPSRTAPPALSHLRPGAPARERLILALDFPSRSASFAFLETLRASLPAEVAPLWVKVGLELFLSAGPSILAELRQLGYRVFLDLKLHDIPNTVASAIRSIAPLGPSLLTLHAAGGPSMLRAAADAIADCNAHSDPSRHTRLLAVTVLTSMQPSDLAAIGIPAQARDQALEPVQQQVERLARLAAASGISGLVCSPQEAPMLRALLPESYLVTPGIRPAGSALGDQHRITTPSAAIAGGATQLVIGRPITAAPDPGAAYLAILQEIAQSLSPPTP